MKKFTFWFFPLTFGLLWAIITVYLILLAAGKRGDNPVDITVMLHSETLLLGGWVWSLHKDIATLQADVAVIKKTVKSIEKRLGPIGPE